MLTIPALLLAANALAGSDKIVLPQPVPKVGQSVVYTLTIDFEAMGQKGAYNGTVKRTVTSVGEDGSTEIESATEGQKISIGGGEQELPDAKETVRTDPEGRPLERDTFENSLSECLAAFVRVRMPKEGAEVGHTWKFDMKGDDRFGELTATVEGKQEFAGRECVAIKVAYTSKAGNLAKGSTYFVASNGVLAGLVMSFEDLELGPGLPVPGTAKMTLKSLEGF
jgi:hypothetical protein